MKICSGKDIKVITGIIAASILLGGCSAVTGTSDGDGKKDVKISRTELKDDPAVKADIEFDKVGGTTYDAEIMDAEYRRYCIDLFSHTVKDYGKEGNVMISPASVMIALDMVAAGAKGESLEQLTDLFAAGQGPLTQQAYAAALMDKINGAEKVEFACANAVWNNGLLLGDEVNMDYVSYIRDTFLAEYTVTDFNDRTADEINSWVDAKTDHMIQKAVDSLDPDTVMVIVNAISFDGEWMEPFEEDDVREGDFTAADGTVRKATFLHGSAYKYYSTDKAAGFIRKYEGGKYSFLAILPNDDTVSANEFAKNFTPEDYEKFINSVSDQYRVIFKIPEFGSDFDILMNDTISDLGADSIFSPATADFSGIAEEPGDIYISRIIHKTHIEVDRKGTRASAVTVIEATEADAEMMEPEYRYVECDRPFIYAVVDNKTMAPVFIGTVNEV